MERLNYAAVRARAVFARKETEFEEEGRKIYIRIIQSLLFAEWLASCRCHSEDHRVGDVAATISLSGIPTLSKKETCNDSDGDGDARPQRKNRGAYMCVECRSLPLRA